MKFTIALLVAVLSTSSAAGAADAEDLTFVGLPSLIATTTPATATATDDDEKKTHYGNPTGGCMKDEHPFQIQGVAGMICAPKCTAFRPCPSDVPRGVTAAPQCALKSPDGNTYCALICSPGTEEEDYSSMLRASSAAASGSGSCGEEATCQAIGGAGICTYSD
mmetsp:Transcript_7086/g.15476  ORF Transcript_7086/g.15476 Transcript_7086/m.15476 type:complete len:164 (+) Transcript_7086:47-538(+)